MSQHIPLFRRRAFSDVRTGERKNRPQNSQELLWFLILLSLLLAAPCQGAVFEGPAGGLSSGAGLPDPAVTRGPCITNTTENSTTIHWRTVQPVPGTVDYSLIPLDNTVPSWTVVSENQSASAHHILLQDLVPGQAYAYRIGGSNQEYSFRTYPASGPIRFIVYGDTREQLPDWDQTKLHAFVASRIAAEKDCLFVVHTGDLVNDPTDEAEWGRFFHAASAMLGNMTFYPVPGNHEGVLTEYGDLFGLPPWYSFRCGDMTFHVLNSNALTPVLTEAQDGWLNQSTGESSPWRFAGVHHPLYSSDLKHWGGYVDVREKYGPVFHEWGIQAVFSAHVHAYEHYEVQGIHYFTLGTGGAPFYPLSPDKPEGYRYSMENTLAYARVTVDQDSTLIEVIPVARVWDGVIDPYPPGTVAERVMITRRDRSDVFVPGFPDILPLLRNPLDIPI